MDKEFMKDCMAKKTKEIEPSAFEVQNPVQIDNLARMHNRLCNYFLAGAKSASSSEAPLLAILLGYFAMEQKAYEILALKGLKVTSHVCAIKGLSREAMRKDLASALSVAYENRLEVNYLGNIKTVDLDRARASKFIEETALPFIAEIDVMIKSIK